MGCPGPVPGRDGPECHLGVAPGPFVEETLNAEVARLIYEARTQAGFTQAALAERIGTTQPVIARLGDAALLGGGDFRTRR